MLVAVLYSVRRMRKDLKRADPKGDESSQVVLPSDPPLSRSYQAISFRKRAGALGSKVNATLAFTAFTTTYFVEGRHRCFAHWSTLQLSFSDDKMLNDGGGQNSFALADLADLVTKLDIERPRAIRRN